MSPIFRRYCIGAIAVLSLMPGTFACAVRAQDDFGSWAAVPESEFQRIIDRLIAEWRRQLELPISSRLQLQFINTPAKPITRAALLAALRKAGMPQNDADITSLAHSILPAGAYQRLWGNVKLLQFADRFRVEIDDSLQLSNGQDIVDYRPRIRQLDISSAATNTNGMSLSAERIRFVPPVTDRMSVALIKRQEGQIFIRFNSPSAYFSELVVDEGTAMVRRRISYGPGPAVVSECWQDDWFTEDEVLWPRIYIAARYSSPETLKVLTFALIDHAGFNSEIPDEEFTQASIPAGTAIVDHRHGTPTRRVLRQSISDPFTDLDTLGPFSQPSPPVPPPGALRLWLIWVNVAVILVLALLLGRRYWVKRQRSA